jgi:molybdopterin converting factor small subunit
MSVKVSLHQSLRHLTDDQAIVEVRGEKVGQCLKNLIEQFPAIEEKLFDKKGNLLTHIEIYVNEESSYPEELAKPVADEDVLSITLMIAGG